MMDYLNKSSSKTRSAGSLQPAGRNALPEASPSYYAWRSSLHNRDAHGEMQSFRRSPLKPAHR
jgi:hypothetical protein